MTEYESGRQQTPEEDNQQVAACLFFLVLAIVFAMSGAQ